MKKILFILLIFAFINSIGQEVNSNSINKKPILFVDYGVEFVVDSASIIGKSIKIGKILVAQYFFKKMMNWNDAKKACASLGKGWRLPNQEELNILYQNRNEIGGFINDDYWCSKEHFDVKYVEAWFQNFGNGAQDYHSINHLSYVRAVRTF